MLPLVVSVKTPARKFRRKRHAIWCFLRLFSRARTVQAGPVITEAAQQRDEDYGRGKLHSAEVLLPALLRTLKKCLDERQKCLDERQPSSRTLSVPSALIGFFPTLAAI
jgi:hypothetical protein